MAKQQRGQARQQILEAADALFGELGFDATTTRLIQERAGVNKALIHYHFKDKQDLFNQVLDGYYAALGEVLRSRLGGASGAGGADELRERLGEALDSYLDFLDAHRSFSAMVQREVTLGRHVEQIVAHMRPLFELGATVVEAALPATRSGPLAAPDLLISFYGMVVADFTYAPVVQGLIGATPKRLEQRKRHLHRMLDLVLDALQHEG